MDELQFQTISLKMQPFFVQKLFLHEISVAGNELVNVFRPNEINELARDPFGDGNDGSLHDVAKFRLQTIQLLLRRR